MLSALNFFFQPVESSLKQSLKSWKKEASIFLHVEQCFKDVFHDFSFTINPLSNSIIVQSDLKDSADDKINVTQELNFLGEGKKILWEKEKMLVTSIFSFSHNVFKSLLFQGH